MRIAIPILVILFSLACDPQGPGAMGQLTTSPEADVDDGRFLELCAFADDGETFDPATANLSERGRLMRESLDLAHVEFPFEYVVGGGMGTSEVRQWRVLAWIAESEALEGPGGGAWYGTRLFELEKCGAPHGDYCGIAEGVDFAIDSRVAAGDHARAELSAAMYGFEITRAESAGPRGN